MIGLQKQTLPHSSRIFHLYAVEINCKLFFVCATYFINLLYSREKNRKKKCWILNDLFQAFENKISFLYAL
jgi:hypothetical protein